MVDCRLKRNRNLASCKRGNPSGKLKCWKKAINSDDKMTSYGKKSTFELVNIHKSNKQYFVTHSNLWTGKLNQRIGSSKERKKAIEKAESYMKEHDTC
ncbi:MAG: hypothetical protein KKB31_05540 [Nanoarchaeota archaeon]|nr:hypothetical protein [Nanoarchaeota archaeon]